MKKTTTIHRRIECVAAHLELPVGFPGDVHGVVDVLAAGRIDAHNPFPSQVTPPDDIGRLHTPSRVLPAMRHQHKQHMYERKLDL